MTRWRLAVGKVDVTLDVLPAIGLFSEEHHFYIRLAGRCLVFWARADFLS